MTTVADCLWAEHVKKMEEVESEKRQAAEAAATATDKADAQNGTNVVVSRFLSTGT